MIEEDAIKLFKCLADKSRIQIIKSLMKEEMYVERLAERLDLTPSTISFHLKKLEDAGAVESRKEQYYMIYSIKKETFNARILDILEERSEEEDIQIKREEEYRKKVVENFFNYGKLKTIPSQRKKRIIILDEIARQFKKNKKYTEKEVNIIIADYHDDFCTLRREMICEQILKRDGAIYWLNQ